MQINIEQRGEKAVVALAGRFDAHVSPVISKRLENAMTTSIGNLVVNLGGVQFIDSTGLATLVQTMKRCRERKGDLTLCELSQPVRIIVELTRLDKAFTIVPSEADAIAL